jgi:hypothetical protein
MKMKKIQTLLIAAAIMLAFAGPARGASREWVGITDISGDRLDVTASGTLPISTIVTFATGTVGISGTVTVQDGGGSITVNSDAGPLAVSGTITATGTVDIGTGTVNVKTLATISNPVTVTATALDIRALTLADVVTATGTVSVTGTVAISNTAFELTDGSETAQINATGALYVEQVVSGTWTAKNYDVPAAATSGVNLDPDAPASVFMLVNEATSPVYVNIGGVAADKTGLYVGPKGSVSCDSATILTLSVYNTSASAVAPISILYGDKRP